MTTANRRTRKKGTKPRVWVVTELYYPETTSTGRFLTGIAESLVPRFDVHVLCSQPTYSARSITAPALEHRNEVIIHRSRATRFNKDVLPLRLMNAFTISLSLTLRLFVVARKGDAILVVTNPPLLPYGVLAVGWMRACPTVLLMHDVYPDVLEAAGVVGSRSLIASVWRFLNRVTYRWCARVVALGRDMATRVSSRYVPENRLVIITNWAEVTEVRPIPRSESKHRASEGLENSFVVQYLGNIGRTHPMEDLVEVADRLRPHPDIRFEIIGSGKAKRYVEDEVTRRSLANVKVLPSVPQRELADTMAAADLAVVGLKPLMTGVSVPSRLYNIMASGRPILAIMDGDAEAARVIQEEGLGWVLQPGDIAGIEAAIHDARQHPDVRKRMEKNGRLVAEARYSQHHVAEKYRALFSEILFGAPT